MILSHEKKFIFIHIYKVAGTSIRRLLDKYNDKKFSDFPVTDNIKFWFARHYRPLSGYSLEHVRAKEIQEMISPGQFEEYFKFSFVRNPWDWQVSLYHFMLQDKTHRQHKLIRKMKNFDEYLNWRINKELEL